MDRSTKVGSDACAEHNMTVNSMIRIINEDLGMCSRVIQEKPSMSMKNAAKGPESYYGD
jgi:hypothetical protein